MHDDLTRIESIYGSVAEYNRVREEQYESYEPSEEELYKQHIEQKVYHKKMEILDGTPSNIARALQMQWEEAKPRYFEPNDPKSYYANRKWYTERQLDVWDKLCTYHGVVENNEKPKGFYTTEPNTFAIQIEYPGLVCIEYKDVNNLDYETFKNLYCDLYFTKCNPSMNYKDKDACNHILSNCSLGELRIYDLRLCGIETEESINRELKDAGFDEETYRKEIS